MQRMNFSPLFRSSIGFDHLERLIDSAARTEQTSSAYPPYNIEVISEDGYRITMAVAGFKESELDITIKENSLVISGRIDAPEDEAKSYLHRGIAARTFERGFRLADHIKVTGAALENGLLHVDLMRQIPEEMKPRTIEIKSADGTQKISQKAA